MAPTTRLMGPRGSGFHSLVIGTFLLSVLTRCDATNSGFGELRQNCHSRPEPLEVKDICGASLSAGMNFVGPATVRTGRSRILREERRADVEKQRT